MTLPKRLSRARLELFLACPGCFWLDLRAKVRQPAGPPFNLNSAVDHLFRNEFDAYRGGDAVPPRLRAAGLTCIPAAHPDLARWRHTFTGVTRRHATTHLELFGAIDDLWRGPDGRFHVVDYKSTSRQAALSIDADWQRAYKRQVEFYQWLLRGNDLDVSPRAYFVYANGIRDDRPFDDVLRFETRIFAYDGDDSWVEPAIERAIACLLADAPPPSSPSCAYCAYVTAVGAARAAPRTGQLF